MVRIWSILSVFFVLVSARENPFAPAGKLDSSVVTGNLVEILEPFEKQVVKFPSDAREFVSLILRYKSEDGSIKEKLIEINRAINWQEELVLSKSKTPSIASKPDVSVTMDLPKIAPNQGEVALKEDVIKQPVKEALIKDVIITPALKPEPLKRVEFNKAVFEIYPMQIKIITKDSKKRDFVIAKGKKIVVDFTSKNGSLTKTFELNCGGFENMTFGNHGDFYRVVLGLDKAHKHEIIKDESGYIIKLKP